MAVIRVAEKVKPQVQAQLQSLQRLTEEALLAARGVVDDAANWAGVACIDARLVISLDGSVSWQVEVEEASPVAVNLQVFVEQYLAQHGYDVRVITEW